MKRWSAGHALRRERDDPPRGDAYAAAGTVRGDNALRDGGGHEASWIPFRRSVPRGASREVTVTGIAGPTAFGAVPGSDSTPQEYVSACPTTARKARRSKGR